ncbi:hypothetical protein K461DRAFT_17131 [Myriangium duriaei CBS 260.36]|uniref:Uncharacterized protein n=1 Tax=Myriangium duriaei CBS 260.36 TaxID=1168546 RepID=A0A9P4JC60_9PEZI|nr:hypothetical protein K461DRAFT_17131 [Myriangium duriaei CBS 260.36]
MSFTHPFAHKTSVRISAQPHSYPHSSYLHSHSQDRPARRYVLIPIITLVIAFLNSIMPRYAPFTADIPNSRYLIMAKFPRSTPLPLVHIAETIDGTMFGGSTMFRAPTPANHQTQGADDSERDLNDDDYPPATGRWVPSRGIMKYPAPHVPYSQGGPVGRLMTRLAGDKIEIALFFDPMYLFEVENGVDLPNPFANFMNGRLDGFGQIAPHGQFAPQPQSGHQSDTGHRLPLRQRRARVTRAKTDTRNAGNAVNRGQQPQTSETTGGTNTTTAAATPGNTNAASSTQPGTRSLGRNARRRRARENREAAEVAEAAAIDQAAANKAEFPDGVSCVELD